MELINSVATGLCVIVVKLAFVVFIRLFVTKKLVIKKAFGYPNAFFICDDVIIC